MSLESILNHILGEAEVQKDKIIQEARQEADKIINQAKKEAEGLYNEILAKEKALAEHEKQAQIVHARLEAKKNLLRAKQDLIDTIFIKLKEDLKKEKLKKQQISHDKTHEVMEDIDFYLNRVRLDYETEIAKVLFR